MKNLLILGGGMAGTTLANKLRPTLNRDEWQITLVDRDEIHYYQPGFLFIPFGIYDEGDVVRARRQTITAGVELVVAEIDRVRPEANEVVLENGRLLAYDVLIIATGTQPTPAETPGLEGPAYGDTIHDFYTFSGATALARKLRGWTGGKLVVHIAEMPIKCPVAPLEFAFLADWFFTTKTMRRNVDITFVTPLPGAFTKPIATRTLGDLLAQRRINVVTEFNVMEVDSDAQRLISYDEREVPYDLLVTVPVNMGATFIEASGLGDELNHVPVDQQTFLAVGHDNIFALGDAAALPTSKAGSVAHFAIDIFVENFVDYLAGRPMKAAFDGHANCFIETGYGKALLIDFNYDIEPLPGKFPIPRLGPLSLLRETRLNHWGKLGFRWAYWNLLLKGRNLYLPPHLSLAGKETHLLPEANSPKPAPAPREMEYFR